MKKIDTQLKKPRKRQMIDLSNLNSIFFHNHIFIFIFIAAILVEVAILIIYDWI